MQTLSSDELGFSLNESELTDTNNIQNDSLTQLNKSSSSATRPVPTQNISKSKMLQ